MTGPHPSAGTFAALRLLPGTDLIGGLRAARADLDTPAVAIAACVGSVSDPHLRFAGRDEGTRLTGPFEIVALSGTLDPDRHHIHLAVSEAGGRVVGGHLLPGTPVRTTAEIVLLVLTDLAFARAPCPLSGYDELTIGPRSAR